MIISVKFQYYQNIAMKTDRNQLEANLLANFNIENKISLKKTNIKEEINVSKFKHFAQIEIQAFSLCPGEPQWSGVQASNL